MYKWKKDKAPTGLKSVTLTAGIIFPQMETFNSFKSGTTPCLVISSCLCLCGLFILNRQDILIMFSTFFCIGCSFVTVIGITIVQGWEFGEISAVCYCLLFGLIINPPLQLALSYIQCPHHQRFEKM
jgi:FtsH-binding integral membrane protein